jgi:hypothetical protein
MPDVKRLGRGRWLWVGLALALAACGLGGSDVTSLQAGSAHVSDGGASTSTPSRPLGSASPQNAAAAPASAPLSPPGLGCPAATPIRPSVSKGNMRFSLRGQSGGAPSTSESPLGGCRAHSAGPEVWYELDLQSLPGPVDFRAVLSADFDAVLDLRRGACGDTLSIDCDRASALGHPGSGLAGRLDPGSYWLVVDGASASSHGDFALELELDPALGACTTPPGNRSCDTAAPLALDGFQSVLLDLSCAPSLGNGRREETLYYELDLSAEPAPVVVNSSVWRLPGVTAASSQQLYRMEPGASGCGSEVHDRPVSTLVGVDTQMSAYLPPGRYRLQLRMDADVTDSRAQLSLQLDRESCRGAARGDTCATAIELDPAQNVQLIDGATLCNANQLSLDCSEGGPAQFYRLDLSASAGPTRLGAAILAAKTDFEPVLFLRTASEGAACGEPLYCADTFANFEGFPLFDLTLQPDSYLIGVGGAEADNAGHYQLLLELSPTEPSPCITAAIAECAFREDSIPCCYDSGVGCSKVLAACGLLPATRQCVCTMNPACCGPDFRDADCAEAHRSCQYLCPEFASSARGCW